jgi:hypothetical protein
MASHISPSIDEVIRVTSPRDDGRAAELDPEVAPVGRGVEDRIRIGQQQKVDALVGETALEFERAVVKQVAHGRPP